MLNISFFSLEISPYQKNINILEEDIEEDISQNNRKRKHANTDTDVDNVYKKLSKSSDSEQQLENEDGTEKKVILWSIISNYQFNIIFLYIENWKLLK